MPCGQRGLSGCIPYAPHLQDNFIAGVLCFTATAAMLTVYLGRGAAYRVWRLRWDVRRHRIFALKTVELALLAASLAAWTYCNHSRTLESECKVDGWPRRVITCRLEGVSRTMTHHRLQHCQPFEAGTVEPTGCVQAGQRGFRCRI